MYPSLGKLSLSSVATAPLLGELPLPRLTPSSLDADRSMLPSVLVGRALLIDLAALGFKLEHVNVDGVCGEIQLRRRPGSERGRCSVFASGMSQGLRLDGQARHRAELA